MQPTWTRRLAVTAALALLVILGVRLADRTEPDWWVEAREREEKLLQHALPGTAEHFRAQQRIDKLDRYAAGEPRPEHPDLFARVHYEMRVPSDREFPEYRPGYLYEEFSAAKRGARGKVDLPWVNRGPFNVSGRARGVVVDSADASNDTWWVGSVGGGIWRTTDAGANWQEMAPDLPQLPISWLVQAESDGDVFYAGTGESMYSVDVINGNGVLKSTDHGATWAPLASTLDDRDFNNISRIIVDPTDPDVVLVSATTGRYNESVNPESNIFRSTDGGANWTNVYTETDLGGAARVKKILQIVAKPGDFQTQLAAIDEKGILKSTDGGQSWAPSNSGISDFIGRFELAFSPVNPSRVFASAEGAGGAKLWLSDDSGSTWTQITEDSGGSPNWLGAQGWYDNTIVCHPTDADIVYVGGIILWKIELVSATTRVTTPMATGPVHVDHHNLMVIDDGGGDWRLINANDGGLGVSSSEDSGWSKPTDGMITGQFYGANKRPGNDAYIGGMQDNGTWFSPIDAGPTDPWTFAIGGDGYEAQWHFDDPSRLIGGYQFNGLMRSLDFGDSWEDATVGMTDVGGAGAPFITKIASSAAMPDRLHVVGASGVWTSNDFGGSWTLAPLSAPDWPTVGSFLDVRVSRADPDVVWAGRRMDASGKIHVSTDGGATFAPATNYVGASVGLISGISTHPTLPGTAFVMFSFAERPKIIRTDDFGASWADITGFVPGPASSNGFPDVAVYDLLVMPHDPNTMWAGSEIGIIESTDGGISWALADNGLPNVPVWFMTQVEDEIVLGTHGRGIWSVEIPAMIAGETFSPLLERIFQGPDGIVHINYNLRSAYESTQFYIDAGLVSEISSPTPAGQMGTFTQVAMADALWQVQVEGTAGGNDHISPVRNVQVYAIADPAFVYTNDFNLPSDDFGGASFSVDTPLGFLTPAIHSPHDYPDAVNITYVLKQPIVVAPSNALIEFNEIVIVEPGEPGAVFGDAAFWDYVIVEASLDGLDWLPTLPGYDCNADPDWRTAYDNEDPIDTTMYRPRVIDLLDTFSPGDHILIRFRLFADALVNGWGWAIDDLSIQGGQTAAPSFGRVSLAQNHPNPFNPTTRIEYDLPARARVSLKVFDARGRLVRTLVDRFQDSGARSVDWDGRDDRGGRVASGVYVYRLVAGETKLERKMTLLK